MPTAIVRRWALPGMDKNAARDAMGRFVMTLVMLSISLAGTTPSRSAEAVLQVTIPTVCISRITKVTGVTIGVHTEASNGLSKWLARSISALLATDNNCCAVRSHSRMTAGFSVSSNALLKSVALFAPGNYCGV